MYFSTNDCHFKIRFNKINKLKLVLIIETIEQTAHIPLVSQVSILNLFYRGSKIIMSSSKKNYKSTSFTWFSHGCRCQIESLPFLKSVKKRPAIPLRPQGLTGTYM